MNQTVQKTLNPTICEDFQNGLTYDKIDRVWRTFREAGNSSLGKITRPTFTKIMHKQFFKNEIDEDIQSFIWLLFNRFKFQKMADANKEQFIDLQDFVIGLVLFSLMSFVDKVKYIFYLTDLDEDGCLSLEEIQSMIQRIEKIFCRQNSSAKVDSFSLLADMAHKKAQRNYSQILFFLYRNNPSLKNDEGGLITGEQFIEALSCSYDLYKEEKFIPLNIPLYEIIKNTTGELIISISEDSKNDFLKFRKELYLILEKTKQGKDELYFPWKVEIIKEKKDKQPEYLQQTQKIIEKERKNEKLVGKGKGGLHKNLYKEVYDQKNTEQTLESYRSKVRKMIETKQDPRLSIKFDKTVRK